MGPPASTLVVHEILQGSSRTGALLAKLVIDIRALEGMVRSVDGGLSLEGIGRLFDDDADGVAGRLKTWILTARRDVHLLESAEIVVPGARPQSRRDR